MVIKLLCNLVVSYVHGSGLYKCSLGGEFFLLLIIIYGPHKAASISVPVQYIDSDYCFTSNQVLLSLRLCHTLFTGIRCSLDHAAHGLCIVYCPESTVTCIAISPEF